MKLSCNLPVDFLDILAIIIFPVSEMNQIDNFPFFLQHYFFVSIQITIVGFLFFIGSSILINPIKRQF